MTDKETTALRVAATEKMMLYLKKKSIYRPIEKTLHDLLEAESRRLGKYYDPVLLLESVMARVELVLRWHEEDIAGLESAFIEYETRG